MWEEQQDSELDEYFARLPGGEHQPPDEALWILEGYWQDTLATFLAIDDNINT